MLVKDKIKHHAQKAIPTKLENKGLWYSAKETKQCIEESKIVFNKNLPSFRICTDVVRVEKGQEWGQEMRRNEGTML